MSLLRVRFIRISVIAALIPLAIRVEAQVCDEDMRLPAPQLGIGLLQCVGGGCGIFGGRPGAYEHRFTVEPRLHRINGAGPAAGLVEDGDQLVAVDGSPITTRRAGRLLAQLTAAPVRLTLRRGSDLRSVSITPRVGCDYPMLIVTKTSEIPAGLDDVAEPSAPVASQYELGLTMDCDGCQWKRNHDGSPVLKSLVVPRVVTVDANGPAARAGLAAGDYLLTIDNRVIASDSGARYLGTIRAGQRVEIGYSRGDRHLTTYLVTARPQNRRTSSW
jgi:hypothetical protein